MKINFTILLLFAVLSVQAQMNEVKVALETANAQSLSTYFGTSVELTIGEKDGIYSKNQAREMVQDFFSKNLPLKFVQRHQSDSGGSKYLIGQLTGKSGAYRAYVLFKKEGSGEVIQALKFEQE